MQRLRTRRTSAFQNRFLALERARLVALVQEWLNVERGRDSFDVLASEEDRVVSVGGLDLKLRLDRVDRLAGGARLLIDYKTGDSEVAMWMGERPDEPQLPLYTLAQTVAADAVAFAHVWRWDCSFVGLAAQGGVADGVTELGRSRYAPDYADWSALLSAWRSTLERLAVAFRSGVAPVDPKKRSITCRNCDLHTLCRVSELADRGSPIAPRRLWMNEGVSAAKTFLFPLIGRQSEAGGR